MRRNLLLAVAVLLVVVVACFFILSEKQEQLPPKDQPLVVNELSDPFNQSFSQLLLSYFEIKNGLVEGDSARANAGAARLRVASDSLRVNDIAGDSTGAIRELAKSYASSLNSAAAALVRDSTLSLKRKQFEVMTDIVWNLTRVVRYKGSKVYYQHCPMAFDNKGAYWVSESPQIRNPYFGHQMLECGTLEDSLDFTNK